MRLYERFTPKEVVWSASNAALKQYRKLFKAEQIGSRSAREAQKRKAIANILSIEEALAEDVRQGKLTREEVMDNYPFDIINTENLIMARFYLMRRNWPKGIEPVLLPAEDIILSAHRVALPKITSTYFSNSNKALRRAVTIQMFAYYLIKQNKIDR